MAAYRPGQGLSAQAVDRLRARQQAQSGAFALPAQDGSKQWDHLLGEGAIKKTRCSICTRPLGDEKEALGQTTCALCDLAPRVEERPRGNRRSVNTAWKATFETGLRRCHIQDSTECSVANAQGMLPQQTSVPVDPLNRLSLAEEAPTNALDTERCNKAGSSVGSTVDPEEAEDASCDSWCELGQLKAPFPAGLSDANEALGQTPRVVQRARGNQRSAQMAWKPTLEFGARSRHVQDSRRGSVLTAQAMPAPFSRIALQRAAHPVDAPHKMSLTEEEYNIDEDDYNKGESSVGRTADPEQVEDAGCDSLNWWEPLKTPVPARTSEVPDVSQQASYSQADVPSVGSQQHSRGRCKPCAFIHKDGCANGRNCQFCHLCPPGVKKQRRKEHTPFSRTSLHPVAPGLCRPA